MYRCEHYIHTDEPPEYDQHTIDLEFSDIGRDLDKYPRGWWVLWAIALALLELSALAGYIWGALH